VTWGCSGTTDRWQPEDILHLELAKAEPAEPLLVGRGRVGYDRRLPEHLTQELTQEYVLVTIRTQEDWDEVRRRLGLPNSPPEVDLSQGAVVGIQARVGESVNNGWPIHIRSVRVRRGSGWLDIDFLHGLYYPLQTASYLELCYVPGLRHVRMVRINHRTFSIHSSSDVH